MNIPETTPWQFVSRQMTAWLLTYLDYELERSGTSCSCCGAPPDSWPTPGEAMPYNDSYGRNQNLCEDCIPLYVSNVEQMGVERLASGNPVAQKFGMMASVKVVADQRGVTMLMPKKIADKLPETFPVPTYVYESLADANAWIYRHDWKYPAVFIGDLGKKKGELVARLAYSYSANRMRICTAEDISTINQVAIQACIAEAEVADKKTRSRAIKLLREVGGGKLSPAGLAAALKGEETLTRIMTKSTPDPQLRLVIAQALSHV